MVLTWFIDWSTDNRNVVTDRLGPRAARRGFRTQNKLDISGWKFANRINNAEYFLLRPRSLFIIYGNRPGSSVEGRLSYFLKKKRNVPRRVFVMQIYAIRFIVSFLKRSRFLDGILLNRSRTKTRLLDNAGRMPLVTEDVNASNGLRHEFCIRFITTFHGIFFSQATSSSTEILNNRAKLNKVDWHWGFCTAVFQHLFTVVYQNERDLPCCSIAYF